MRSEKEIKEKMEVLKKSVGTNEERIKAGTFGKFTEQQASDSILYWRLKWVLEGPSRYSIAELEKLEAYIEEKELPDHGVSLVAIDEFIKKNPKKVEEILK